MSYLDALEQHKTRSEEVMQQVHASQEDWLAEDIESFYGTTEHGPETPAAIDAFEQRIGFALPGPLKALYLNHGGFDIFEEYRYCSVRIPSIEELIRPPGQYSSKRPEWPFLYGGLATYGSPAEFDNHLSPEQLRPLREDMVLFGEVSHSYSSAYVTLLAFHRNGSFFQLPYGHDTGEREWNELYHNVGAVTLSLDDLLEPRIRKCTAELGRRLEENHW
ncbi:hypothetical protein HNP48_004310 [Acidovorax soli]|uniref:Knr4/Smi1-like domain-containing protein n=1 Tax=Acidovorax soli TaxID=592050 RepID=A0A7X0UAU3_9BURK|nr:SMI1/KNR4 family protein [Acidovorax soli]MBB6561616.1 hypothetical protein [Acidovorax soli]